MKRITRDGRLTPEEAAKYTVIRAQVAEELLDLIARHHERMESFDQSRKRKREILRPPSTSNGSL